MSDITIPMDRIISGSSLIPTDFGTYDITFVDGEAYKIDVTKKKNRQEPSWEDFITKVSIRPHVIGEDHDWFWVEIFTPNPNEFHRSLAKMSERYMPLNISDVSLTVQLHIDDLHEQWLDYTVRAAYALHR